MGVIPRRRIIQNLKEVEVFVEDIQNEYFRVQDVPDTFVQGRSAFKIIGSPLLKASVPLKIEMLDKRGDTVYVQPVKYGQQSSPILPYRYVSVEVYSPPITVPGEAELVILGELEETEVPFTIPNRFIGTYNVRYRKTVNIDTSTIINTQPILFYKKPDVSATATTIAQKKSDPPANAYKSGSGTLYGEVKAGIYLHSFPSGSAEINELESTDDGGKSDTPAGDIKTETNLWKYKTGAYTKRAILNRRGVSEEMMSPGPPQMTLFSTVRNAFNTKMVGGTIDVTNVQLTPKQVQRIAPKPNMAGGGAGMVPSSSAIARNFSGRIESVLSDYKITVSKPYSAIKKVTHPQGGKQITRNFGIYTHFGKLDGYEGFDTATGTFSDYSASYVDWAVPSTSSYRFDTFIDMDISNMRTFSGDIYRLKVYGASDSSQGDFPVLLDTIIESPERLVDNSVEAYPLRSGYFMDQTHLDKYWDSYGGDNQTATLRPYYTMSLADSVYLSGSYSDFNTVGRFELKQKYGFTVKKDVPYTLAFNAKARKTTKTINTNGDVKNYAKLMFHLKGSELASDDRLDITYSGSFGHSLTNAVGQKVGLELKSDQPSSYEFPRLSHTFYPKFKLDRVKNTDTILQMRIEAGEWYISDVSLRPAQDTGFSPDEMKIRVPIDPNTQRPDNFDFLIEYYDINGNTAEAVTFINNVGISGSALVVEGDDNMLSGSLYLGNVQGSGIEIHGGSAYMRSIGYEGFTSASAGGQGGFMIWSGSVLPNAPDDYSGSGLEIHDGITGSAESYFKFRTIDSANDGSSSFDVKTSRFFFGSVESGNYVSGALGNIEITSSNFHLSPTGDVTMQGEITAEAGGTIGGFTIASDSLTATNFVLDTGDKSLSLGSGEDIFIADADTGIQLGSATFADAEFSVTPAGVLKAESGTIADWTLSTGTISKTTATKYTGLSSAGNTRIFAGADNLTAGTGSAPFNVKADGNVTASAGLIGGWSLRTNDLNSPNGRITMSAYPSIERITIRKANMNELIRMGAIDDTAGASPKYGLKIYDGTGVYNDDTKEGQIVLLGEQGNRIAGWELTNTQLRTVPNSGLGGQYNFDLGEEGIILVSNVSESAIHTAGFVSGLKGFKISSLGNGTAEFENCRIRGTLRTTVFEKESVNVVGGQLMVANSTTIGALKSGSVIVAGNASASATDVTMSCMNVSGFARGEILKAKKISDTGFAVEYMYVTGSKRFSEDPALAYLTASLGTASSGEDMPPLDPDGIAGELYVGRAYGGPDTARGEISSSLTKISGSIELKEGGSDGSGIAFGAVDVIYVNSSGSLAPQDIIQIGQEKMKVTRVIGSLPVLGAAGLKTSASLHVIRDFNDTVPQVHNHGADVIKFDSTGSLDVAFLKGLVSTAQTYNEGQVLVSTGKYAQGTDWRGRFNYRYNVSSVDAASKYKLTGDSGLLTTSGKKDATGLEIHAVDNDAESHHSLFGQFDKGSYIVLLVDSVREWYRYRVTGNPSFTGTSTGSIHTYPIKLNQDFYNAGSSLDTADRVVQFWFMSSIQDVSSGYILMNANPNDLYSPYLDIVERTGPDVYDLQLRTRLGDLSGLSSAYLYGDEEPGFGLYTENGYFAGSIHATTGSIHGILHIATVQGGIETGEKISMGRDVYGSNDGIIIGTSGNNYWWTTGDFRVGSEAKYLDFNNSAGTFELKTDSLEIDAGTGDLQLSSGQTSMSLADGAIRLAKASSGVAVAEIGSDKTKRVIISGSAQLGVIRSGKTSVSDTTAGFWLANNSTDQEFVVGDATDYIRYSGSGVTVKSRAFELDANTGDLQLSSTQKSMSLANGNITLDGQSNSGAGHIEVGGLTSTAANQTAKGLYVKGDGDFIIKSNTTANENYIQGAGGDLIIKADDIDITSTTFDLNAGTGDLQLSSTQKSMSFADGKIILEGSSSYGSLQMGTIKSVTDTTSSFIGVYSKGDGNIIIKSATTDYLQFNNGAIDIKATTFNLVSSTISASSAAGGKITGGKVTSLNHGPGFYLSGSGEFRFGSGSNTQQIMLQGTGSGTVLTISTDNFSVDSGGTVTATNAILSGQVTATTGQIGGWDIGANTLSSANVVISSVSKSVEITDDDGRVANLKMAALTPTASVGGGTELVVGSFYSSSFTDGGFVYGSGGGNLHHIVRTTNATTSSQANYVVNKNVATDETGDSMALIMRTGTAVSQSYNKLEGTDGKTYLVKVALTGHCSASLFKNGSGDHNQYHDGHALDGAATVTYTVALMNNSGDVVLGSDSYSKTYTTLGLNTTVTNGSSPPDSSAEQSYKVDTNLMNFSFAVTLTDDINTYLKITQNITANTLRNSYLDSSGGEIPETEYESSNVTFKAIPSLVQIRGNANLTELTTQGIQTIYDPIVGSDGKFFRIDFSESGATDMFIQSAGYWSHNNKFFAKDDITAFHSSDRRLKENIEIIDDPLKKISQIEGVSFSWKDKEKYPLEYHNERELGVIAQDVLPVLPEIVKKRTDGYYAIKYEQIVPVLIEAVKQQQGDIIKLEERVIILEKQLDSEV